MPLNTSDFHKTISVEMRMAKAMKILGLCDGDKDTKSSSFATLSEHIAPNNFTFPSMDSAVQSIPKTVHKTEKSIHLSSFQINANHQVRESNGNILSNNGDLLSVETLSSDMSFTSCQTHPFFSQGDLTLNDLDEGNQALDMLDSESLYLNAMKSNAPLCSAIAKRQVKKSTSGDLALRNFGSIGDAFSRSRVSLNETPLPKHQKTRFQHQQQQQQLEKNSLPYKTSFDDVNEAIEKFEVISTSSNKKNRRASFMPTKIITNTTKQLLNQHLFGNQTKGKNCLCNLILMI